MPSSVMTRSTPSRCLPPRGPNEAAPVAARSCRTTVTSVIRTPAHATPVHRRRRETVRVASAVCRGTTPASGDRGAGESRTGEPGGGSRCGQERVPSETGLVVFPGGTAPGLARPGLADADHGADGGGGADRAGGGAQDRHRGRPVPGVRGPLPGAGV